MTEPVLARLIEPTPLGDAEARRTFAALLAPGATDVDRASILVALATRAIAPSELACFAAEMRRRARPFPLAPGDRPVDLCGSGGAPRPSFNVSTVSAFVVAAAGASVVKHGNRSARGRCGSSDLLEALGLPVVASTGFARASYRRFGLAFLHAPLFHPATAAVASVRAQLGIPTVFNRLGPLSNPARVPFQVVGAPSAREAVSIARTLSLLGVERGVAMASEEGCDEFSPQGVTTLVTWNGARLNRRTLHAGTYLAAEDRRGPWSALDPVHAAEETERILAGGGGARRGSVLLTSAAALWIAGRAASFARGLERAREALDDGRAERLLRAMRGVAARHGGRRARR